MRPILLLSAGVFLGGQAYGMINLEVRYGQLTAEAVAGEAPNHATKKTIDHSSTRATSTNRANKLSEISLGAHLQIFPTIPISAGWFLASRRFVSQDGRNFARAEYKGSQFGPDILAWLPGFTVTPLVRLGYSVGTYVTDYEASLEHPRESQSGTAQGTFHASGARFGIGVRYRPLPVTGLVAEYQVNREQVTGEVLIPMQTDKAQSAQMHVQGFVVAVELGI